jgi:hypothetical protein
VWVVLFFCFSFVFCWLFSIICCYELRKVLLNLF